MRRRARHAPLDNKTLDRCTGGHIRRRSESLRAPDDTSGTRIAVGTLAVVAVVQAAHIHGVAPPTALVGQEDPVDGARPALVRPSGR